MSGNDVNCYCIVVGLVGDYKGINFFGVVVFIFVFIKKDEENLCWVFKVGIDFVVLFFV